MENADPEGVELKLDLEPEPDAHDPEAIGDPAVEAFARLEGEVAMMRRAVQHLAAERADIVIPDYGKTLEAMSKRLGEICGNIEVVAGHPAMQLTPDSLGKRIEAASEAAMRGDQGRINDALGELRQASQDMRAVTAHARTDADQRRRLFQAAGGGALAGMLLWSFLPGTIARAMPESWHWPERMAARMVGESSRWDAGARLMRGDSPQAWDAIVQASRIERENRQVIAGCAKSANAARESVRCSVKVPPMGS